MNGPRSRPIGISKEEREKQRERHAWDREDPHTRDAGQERDRERTADERQTGGIETQSAARLRLAVVPVPAQNVLHAVFQLEFSLLEGDFFDLFGLGEVVLGGELV